MKLLDSVLRTGVFFLESGMYYAFRDNQVRQNLLEVFSLEIRHSIHKEECSVINVALYFLDI